MAVETWWADEGLEFRREGAVAWLVLDRPHRRNAVSVALRHALTAAIAETRQDPEIRAVVVAATGSSFCSGADLGEPDWFETDPDRRRGERGNMAREDGRQHGWWRLIKDIMENEKPFVAAVNGPAFGFGCNLALACDLVIAAESAQFSEIFIKRGLPMEAAGAYMMAKYLSPARAKEMALLGDVVDDVHDLADGLDPRAEARDDAHGLLRALLDAVDLADGLEDGLGALLGVTAPRR